MSVLKNKHVVVALIVAPILAIISYFAVDHMVSETPKPAEPGASYPMVEKSNCRYNSGVCALENGEFEIRLSTTPVDDDHIRLILNSRFPLEGALVSLRTEEQEGAPLPLAADDETGQRWVMELPRPEVGEDRILIAVSANESVYYGDVATDFTLYKTSFGEDFRKPL